MPKLIPSVHILHERFNKGLSAATAFSELISNGLRTGDKMWITLLPDRIIVTDNGEGVSNMDAMFGLGQSESRYDPTDIGEFGIGSKDAQMHFGKKCTVQTVYEGRYYVHSIDWERVERTDWPEAFSGFSRAVDKAPVEIRDGGTILTISKLFDRRINVEMTVKRLTHRFRPGLLKGCEIIITDNRYRRPKVYKLDKSVAATAVALEGETKVKGEVLGKKFTLTYATLKEQSDFNGVHIGFDKQFVVSKQYLNKTGMPSRLYAEVILSSRWKGCFSPNKERMIRHEFEVEVAVLNLLRDFINKLSHEAEHVRIEHINLALATDFENVIILDDRRRGKHVKDEETDVTKEGGRGGDGPPNPDKPEEKVFTAKPTKKDEDGHGTQQRKRSRGGISFTRKDNLGPHVAAVAIFDAPARTLRVELNGTFPVIELAYQNPYKPTGLWPIIAREIANFCRDNAKGIDDMLPGFVDALDKLGYGIETDRPNLFADKVFAYIMKQCPMTTTERAKLGKVRSVRDDSDEDTPTLEQAINSFRRE